MNDEITRVKSLPDFKLQVTLADGRQGVFSLVPHLASPSLIALRDPAYFSQVQILFLAPQPGPTARTLRQKPWLQN